MVLRPAPSYNINRMRIAEAIAVRRSPVTHLAVCLGSTSLI